MIPEVDEHNKIENSDNVGKQSDQSGSDEIPTMSATSATPISWSCDMSPQIVPCTRDCKVKIPLAVKDIPFLWLKVFGWWSNKSIYSRNKLVCTSVPQYSWTVSTLSWPQLGVTKSEIWTYLWTLFMTGIDRWPEIVDYWSTKLFFCTSCYGPKWPSTIFNRFLNSCILLTMKQSWLIVRTDYIRCDQS